MCQVFIFFSQPGQMPSDLTCRPLSDSTHINAWRAELRSPRAAVCNDLYTFQLLPWLQFELETIGCSTPCNTSRLHPADRSDLILGIWDHRNCQPACGTHRQRHRCEMDSTSGHLIHFVNAAPLHLCTMKPTSGILGLAVILCVLPLYHF